MRPSRLLVRARLARRLAIVLALVLSSAGLVISEAAPPAFACGVPDQNHCYAIAIDNGYTSTNYGVQAEVYSNCLYLNNDVNFADQEIWDTNMSQTSWEEVGITSGTDPISHIYYSAKTWFWADNRSGSYNEHFPDVHAAYSGVNYTVLLTFDGNEQWSIWGGNSYVLLGASTGQKDTLNQPQAGTEYTSAHGADMRNAGNVNSLEQISTSGDSSSWPSQPAGNPDLSNSGPGEYITGSYDNSNPTISYSWSC